MREDKNAKIENPFFRYYFYTVFYLKESVDIILVFFFFYRKIVRKLYTPLECRT